MIDYVQDTHSVRIRDRNWGNFQGDTTCECARATENTAHMMQWTQRHLYTFCAPLQPDQTHRPGSLPIL